MRAIPLNSRRKCFQSEINLKSCTRTKKCPNTSRLWCQRRKNTSSSSYSRLFPYEAIHIGECVIYRCFVSKLSYKLRAVSMIRTIVEDSNQCSCRSLPHVFEDAAMWIQRNFALR
mmetsp:Transcript_603/g.815  ORF Transcript_603/g.815 Transcript_603/m.815 type:complete len:115 (-) Transcript_603:176-520(-)